MRTVLAETFKKITSSNPSQSNTLVTINQTVKFLNELLWNINDNRKPKDDCNKKIMLTA
jgi:hypothetical protein